MAMLSPPPRHRPPRPTLPTDTEELLDLAERLGGWPVPGVRMTERQFTDWCRVANVKAEWVGGEVVVLPIETPGHNRREFLLGQVVSGFVDRFDLGEVFIGTVAVRLPGQRRRRVPDLAFVTAARADIITANEIDGPPDLMVEIVSPGSASRDWVDKRAEYEAAGVREYWIADVRNEHFAPYALHGRRYRKIGADADGRVYSKVLKGLYVRPAWLWQQPLPKVAAILRELDVR